ncbi:SDR family NAD(P)-dependent oxidoreductase [Rathayibacter sp. CAU 1779]
MDPAPTYLITGGTAGIGLAVAKLLTNDGAHVIITGRRQGALDDAVELLGGSAHGIRADSASAKDLDELFAGVREHEVGLDGLVVNAGGGDLQALEEVTPDDIDRAFGANVRGAILTVQKAIELLRPHASIVIIGSTVAEGGAPGFGLYSGAKAALRALTRTWAAELAGRGFRVNQVVPGPTDTPGLSGLAPDNPEALLDRLRAHLPFKRLVQPDETAEVVRFLLSPRSSAITGSELYADGGEAHHKSVPTTV